MATPRRPGQRAGVTNSRREITPTNTINPTTLGAFSRTRKPGFPSRRAPSRLVALRLSASGHLPGNPSRMRRTTRSIAHACGLTRSFTHVCLWIGTFYHPRPIRSITHALLFQIQHWRGLQNVIHSRNARAHFLTLNIFNALAVCDRGTPSGFPQPSVGSPSR